MKRLTHGSSSVLDEQLTPEVAAADIDENTVRCPIRSPIEYLFSDLQDPLDFLPEEKGTAQRLIELGESMTDFDPQDFDPNAPAAEPDKDLESQIPSVYTYFGQFITHEIVFEDKTKN